MNSPFFIIGIGRSGTTLLRLMLHNHPRLAIPYETDFIVKYQLKISQFGDLSQKKNFKQLLTSVLNEPAIKQWDRAFDADSLLDKIKDRSLAGMLDAIYTDYAESQGKYRWGDKSPYFDRIDVIQGLFPNAQFIHLIRDGRDMANSVLKLSWGPNDIIRAAEWWSNHVWVVRRMGAILGPKRYIEIKYENLVHHSEDELKRICDFIGEDYSPAMLDFHKRAENAIPESKRALHYNTNAPPKTSRVYAWKKEMRESDQMLFNRHATTMLTELGYEIPPIKRHKLVMAYHYLTIFARRFLTSGSNNQQPAKRQS